jgi:membrane fusion protein, copper/silver efflux system
MSNTRRVLPILAVVLTAGIGGYWLGHNGFGTSLGTSELMTATSAAQTNGQAPSGPVIYYRHPDNRPFYSLEPKTTPDGRPYRPVLAGEDISLDSDAAKSAAAQPSSRRIRYYRNPMGLPDTSPVPKKDWMGMDYIPVYEGEEEDDGKTVKVSLDKVQRSGVRTQAVEARVIVRPVRAVGTVMHDESRLTVVAMRSDAYIEELFVNKAGQHVHAGDPLFRVYSPDIVSAQVDLRNGGSEQRLRNLGVPESHIREVRSGKNPMSLVWPAPATGDVIEKRVINGQRVKAGDELYRIADHTHLWVVADVSESDLSAIKLGTRVTVAVRAYAAQPVEGEVTFIYPELRTETRTARVRIELPNLDGRLKIDMYADVVFQTATNEQPVIAVPANAVIDSGTRQIVLVVKAEGRFEPRAVKLGRRGDGYVEVLDGVNKGEEVVTAATFLIDAESNLKAALQAFAQPEASK